LGRNRTVCSHYRRCSGVRAICQVGPGRQSRTREPVAGALAFHRHQGEHSKVSPSRLILGVRTVAVWVGTHSGGDVCTVTEVSTDIEFYKVGIRDDCQTGIPLILTLWGCKRLHGVGGVGYQGVVHGAPENPSGAVSPWEASKG
jgi:hypothetical protein